MAKAKKAPPLAMRKAKKGSAVAAHLVGTLEDGTEFMTTRDSEPFDFVLGEGTIIGGLERVIEGMVVGEKKRIILPPEKAFGQSHDNLIFVVPRDQIKKDAKKGDEVKLNLADEEATFRVVKLTGKQATLDGNHPLAGKTVTFKIELVSIK